MTTPHTPPPKPFDDDEQQIKAPPALGAAKVRRLWFTMVLVPSKGWTRVGRAYVSEKAARSWLLFVSGAWHGLSTKTAQCTLRWIDGVMDERSRRILSEKFNMEPPAAPPNPANEPRR